MSSDISFGFMLGNWPLDASVAMDALPTWTINSVCDAGHDRHGLALTNPESWHIRAAVRQRTDVLFCAAEDD